MTITDFNYESSYLPSLTCNMYVRAPIGRSCGRSTGTSTPQDLPMDLNSNFSVQAHMGEPAWVNLTQHC